MKLQITPVDHELENNGTWTSYRGVDLLIARGNNTRFKATFRRLTKPYQRDIDDGTLPEEKSADILSETLADAVLLGWKNFIQEGKEIEYSRLNAKNLLLNDIDCRDFVTDFSSELENYIIQDSEQIMGEVQPS